MTAISTVQRNRISLIFLGFSTPDLSILFSAALPNHPERYYDLSHNDSLNEGYYCFPKFLPFEPYLDAEGDETDEPTCEGLTSPTQLIIHLGEDRESTKYENAFPHSL